MATSTALWFEWVGIMQLMLAAIEDAGPDTWAPRSLTISPASISGEFRPCVPLYSDENIARHLAIIFCDTQRSNLPTQQDAYCEYAREVNGVYRRLDPRH
ncbi:hypothetical protein BD410DRAFT_791745 [Rickenella mellea]|uniref:Uncharacterized protein n=1 Tax=Rickenella mellea TaxID=50990 RepID=A0A4Y7PXI7_9AGAM|nr:hypothetical protein BD410DRAFT_791745 [Rickenella mellea]